ncbi:MAG: hypothetical protein Q9208_000367 [Pyrenodesmia sp. 3 TL-2023]
MAVFASLRATAFPPPPHPPPSGPLPELPPGATAGTPPTTPRNASNLYGEYSWPSLDTVGLQSQLEDVVAGAEDNSPKKVDDHHGIFSINQLATAMQTIVSELPLAHDLYGVPTPKLISLAHKLRQDFEQIRPEYLPATEEELKDYLDAKADYHHQVTMLHIDSGFCYEGCPLQEDCAFFDDGCPYRLGHECWGSRGCEHTSRTTLLDGDYQEDYRNGDRYDEEAPRFDPEWEESDQDAGAAGSSDYYEEWYHHTCHHWARKLMNQAKPIKRVLHGHRFLRPLVLLARGGAKSKRHRWYRR